MQSPTRECILSSASSSNEIFVSGKNEFCRIVGNGISFESLVLGEAKKNKTWIPNQQGSGGIACVAVDVISKCVAYSPRSSQPKIYLHNAETKKLLGVLPTKNHCRLKNRFYKKRTGCIYTRERLLL